MDNHAPAIPPGSDTQPGSHAQPGSDTQPGSHAQPALPAFRAVHSKGWEGFTFSDSIAAISILLILSAAFFSAIIFIYRNTDSIMEKAGQEARAGRIMQAAEQMSSSISLPYWANVEHSVDVEAASVQFQGGYALNLEENGLRFIFPEGELLFEISFETDLEELRYNGRAVGVLIQLVDPRKPSTPVYSIPIIPASYPLFPAGTSGKEASAFPGADASEGERR